MEAYEAEAEARRERNRLAQRKYRKSVKRRLCQTNYLQRRIADLENALAARQSFPPVKPSSEVDRLMSSGCQILPLRDGSIDSDSATFWLNNHSSDLMYSQAMEARRPDSNPSSQCSPHSFLDFDSVLRGGSTTVPTVGRVFDFDGGRSPVFAELGHKNRSALSIAAGDGNLDLVKVLLEYGASVCTVDAEGSTALHRAFEGGHVAVARLLIQYGVKDLIDRADGLGRTSLRIAVESGHVELACLALESGAKADST